jgi:hypothetical protein
MDKVLGITYLSIVAILVIVYLFVYINGLIFRIAYKRLLRQKKDEADKSVNPVEVFDIVGKSTVTFLAPLILESNDEPFMSTDLEPEKAKSEVETEPEIPANDIETNIIGNDELDDFSDNEIPADELSRGLTFEQIGHALEVFEGRKSSENDEYLAGETFSMMPTDFLNVICMQVEHEMKVKRLIACYVDATVKIKPVSTMVSNFDINKFV